jgi:hypothetical protein
MTSRNANITIPDFKEAHMKMSLDLEGKSFISDRQQQQNYKIKR